MKCCEKCGQELPPPPAVEPWIEAAAQESADEVTPDDEKFRDAVVVARASVIREAIAKHAPKPQADEGLAEKIAEMVWRKWVQREYREQGKVGLIYPVKELTAAIREVLRKERV